LHHPKLNTDLVWSDKLKINKQLLSAMNEAGYTAPKEIQDKTMKRINGGQDIIAVGPEGIGKTTTYVLSVLMRLKFAHEEAPRALVLVPDKEKVLEVVEQFNALGKNTSIRTLGLFGGVGMEPQLDALADGVDVVVGTPDRVRAIYLKLALNMNKISMFILDDADLFIKQGMQLPVSEIARSLSKCQHLVFCEVMHDKLDRLISPFLNYPALIEVNAPVEAQIESHDQVLYHVPNFRTKLNLLNLLLSNSNAYPKAIVFVNTRVTAAKVYAKLKQRIGDEAALFKPLDFDQEGFSSINEFKEAGKFRVLVIADEAAPSPDLTNIPFIFHFELPVEKETYVERIQRRINEEENKPLYVTFATDIELSLIRKIEQSTGKIPEAALPVDLKVETDEQKRDPDTESNPKEKTSNQNESGGAFHEKKQSNAKQYNYGFKDKQKMAGKVSKRRNS